MSMAGTCDGAVESERVRTRRLFACDGDDGFDRRQRRRPVGAATIMQR